MSKPRVSWLLDKLRMESFFENGGFFPIPYRLRQMNYILCNPNPTLFSKRSSGCTDFLSCNPNPTLSYLRKIAGCHDIFYFNPFLFKLSLSLWVMEEAPNLQTKGELTFGQTENGKLFWKWRFPPIPYCLRQMNYILSNPNPNPTLFSLRSSGCSDAQSCNPNPTLFLAQKFKASWYFAF